MNTQGVFRSRLCRSDSDALRNPQRILNALGTILRWTALLTVAVLAPATRAQAAVTAVVSADTLLVTGDGANDVITLRLVAGNSTQVEVVGVIGTFDRATFSAISVDGGGGADTILIDDINGVFTDSEATALSGGIGNDAITGGGGLEVLNGG